MTEVVPLCDGKSLAQTTVGLRFETWEQLLHRHLPLLDPTVKRETCALDGYETHNVTTTVKLLSSIEKPGQTSTQSMEDALPQYVSTENATNKSNYSKPATMEPKTSQMTIFYGGQVLVFDDFPAEKVTEIMLLANKGSAAFVSTPIAEHKVDNGAINSIPSSSNAPSPNLARNHLQPQTIGLATSSNGAINSNSNGAINSIASSSNGAINSVASSSNASSPNLARNHLQPQTIGLATRASLNRFFEKRKDRATAKAPYQLRNSSPTPPKHEEQFDLNL